MRWSTEALGEERQGGLMRQTDSVSSKRRWDQRGITSVEYALLLAFIGAGIILAADTLSTAVSDEMKGAAECISGTDADCNVLTRGPWPE